MSHSVCKSGESSEPQGLKIVFGKKLNSLAASAMNELEVNKLRALRGVEKLKAPQTDDQKYLVVYMEDGPPSSKFRIRKRSTVCRWHDGLEHATFLQRPLTDSERCMSFPKRGTTTSFRVFAMCGEYVLSV